MSKVETTPAPPAQSAGTDPAADSKTEVETKPLNVFERAGAKLKSREAFASEIKGLKDQLAERDAEIAQLKESLAAAQAEADQGKQLAERVAQLEEEQETTSQKAANIAASSHVESSALPPATDEKDMVPDSKEALEAALNEAFDHKERSRILREYRKAHG